MASSVSSIKKCISGAVAASRASISAASESISATSGSIFERANIHTLKLTGGLCTLPEAGILGGILGLLAYIEIPWFMFGKKK